VVTKLKKGDLVRPSPAVFGDVGARLVMRRCGPGIVLHVVYPWICIYWVKVGKKIHYDIVAAEPVLLLNDMQQE